MVQIGSRKILFEDSLEIPPEVQKKLTLTRGMSSFEENAVSDLEFVSITDHHYLIFKRVLDVVLSVVALVIIAIPMLIIFLIMYIDDPGNVIFSQYRVGMGGRRFKLYKLRTMRQDTPKYMSTSEVDDPNRYITRVGRILAAPIHR